MFGNSMKFLGFVNLIQGPSNRGMGSLGLRIRNNMNHSGRKMNRDSNIGGEGEADVNGKAGEEVIFSL